MLKHLYIKDYTLISCLDMDFSPGFSVITGETGAGKSIILGALGLLLGQRADTKAIKDGCSKCTIEAHFSFADNNSTMKALFADNELDFDPDDCIVRRELSATGKSRAFINDTPAPLSLLKELGDKLMDIHSQHQNLLLNNEDFQLHVVDIIAGNADKKEQYQSLFSHYTQARAKAAKLSAQIAEIKRNEDFLRYQYNELLSAALQEGEYSALQEEYSLVSHTEDIKSALYQADTILTEEPVNIVYNLRQAANHLSAIQNVYPKAVELHNRLNSTYIEVEDISHDISALAQDVDFDPQRLEYINERMSQLNTLIKKYKADDPDTLLAIRDDLALQLSHIDNSDVELVAAEKEAAILLEQLKESATILSATRKQASQVIEKQMEQTLIPLGMPNIRFEVKIESKEHSADGADKVQFYFSANKNAQLQPISQIASGGEIARVMLSLKALISGAVQLPTIIFDEIDTGVSGSIAEKMAEVMADIACKGRQVISITHLPQIAARGDNHYKVFKEDNDLFSETKMQHLDTDQRVKEIAKMLSGSKITDEAIGNAKSLLKI